MQMENRMCSKPGNSQTADPSEAQLTHAGGRLELLAAARKFRMKRVEQQTALNHSARPKRSGLTVGVQRIRKAMRRRYARCLRKLGKNHQLSLALVDDPVELGSSKSLARLANRQTAFSSPLLFDQQLEIIRQPALQTEVPDLQFLELNDVGVVGATMAVVREGKVLHPELLHTKEIHDDKAPDICRFADAGRKILTFNTYTRFGGRPRVKAGVHLLKEHSSNFYHWLFECLPRLMYFSENLNQAGQHEEFTVLIEDNILAQGLEAMRRVINFPFQIETVRRGELVLCDKLFYVSPFWFSLDNSKHRVDPYRDYAVDKLAVEKIRDAFRPLMKSAPPTRKLYLPRAASQARRIINAQAVEDLMRENGFEIIYPHHFSFAGQVELFSSAKIVIGASGAAFSNMVFMQPGTKAVIFSPKQLDVFNYYIFQQQADVAQVELMHLLAAPAKHDNFYVHDDFLVNCDDLQALIRRMTS